MVDRNMMKSRGVLYMGKKWLAVLDFSGVEQVNQMFPLGDEAPLGALTFYSLGRLKKRFR